MSGNGRAGGGRGYNRKRHFRNDASGRNDNFGRINYERSNNSDRDVNPAGTYSHDRRNPVKAQDNRQGNYKRDSFRKTKAPYIERPRWIPPRLNTDPLPSPDCPWCGKPIRDISSAIADKDTGAPVHFDCVAARIAGAERLEGGDTVTYIGGGRFGIVNFGRTPGYSQGRGPVYAGNDFRIKKIIEWENKDNRAQWRSEISDHYSVT